MVESGREETTMKSGATPAHHTPTMRKRTFPALIGLLVACYVVNSYFLPRSWLSYASRPLWDAPEWPTELTAWSPGSPNCAAVKWDDYTGPRRETWDAVIFSTEADMLALRLEELDSVVDRFFVLEATSNFMGQSRDLVLKSLLVDPKAGISKFRAKLTYQAVDLPPLARGDSPFTLENAMRNKMTDLLRDNMPPAPVPPPVMIFTDVDEIPSKSAVALLSRCVAPLPMHLGMKEYLYSFEFPLADGGMEEGLEGLSLSWRGSARSWEEKGKGPDEFYGHSKVSERVLPAAGWHCSFCFRTIPEFISKMSGYSHSDRLGSRPGKLLRPERIQETICKGHDIFRMLPEVYSYKSMWRRLENKPTNSTKGLPEHLLQNKAKYPYLLPGGCIREA